MKWFLLVLAFLLGALITWFWMVRRVSRKVPRTERTTAGGRAGGGAAGTGAASAPRRLQVDVEDGPASGFVPGFVDRDDLVSNPADGLADDAIDAEVDATLAAMEGGDAGQASAIGAGTDDSDGGHADEAADDSAPEEPDAAEQADADEPSAAIEASDVAQPREDGSGGEASAITAAVEPEAVEAVEGDADQDADGSAGSQDPTVNETTDEEPPTPDPAADDPADEDLPTDALVAAGFVAGPWAGSAKTAAGDPAPAGFDIKGNGQSMLFHTPDSPWYARTKPEVWFDTEENAAAAGFTHWKRRGAKPKPTAVAGPYAGSVLSLEDGSGPEGFDIKGNEQSQLFHTTDSPWYARTKPEVWFDTEENAVAAGFLRWDHRRKVEGEATPSYIAGPYAGSARPAEDGAGPDGWTIKGNEGSMLYHTPESPWYGRTKAEFWFDSEDNAESAGFARWDRRSGGDARRVVEPEAPSYVAGPYAGSAVPNEDGSGPEGWTIKGNQDSMLFHTIDSPWYRRTKAEVWFDTEDSALAAGFARWDRNR